MLSRIAESLFWIGRYVERADATARVLDVHLARSQDDPHGDTEVSLGGLLAAMGVTAGNVPVTSARVVEVLAYGTRSTSITASLRAARENARGAREILPAELWEVLNVTWHGIGERRAAAAMLGPAVFCQYVRERTAMANGLVNSLMVRDEGWRFLTLGTWLERIDMAARLLSTPALAEGNSNVLAGLLRSTGAHDTFIRVYQGAVTPMNVCDFLLRDRLAPRSVAFALSSVEEQLRGLEPDLSLRPTGYLRALGSMRATLEFRSSEEIIEDLPALVEQLQRLTSRTSDEVTTRFFGKSLLVRWAAEVSA